MLHMSDLFEAHTDFVDGWDVLLVYMFSAFSSLNHTSILLHAHVLWPRCSCFVVNSYCGWSFLVLWGSPEYCIAEKVLLKVNLFECLCVLFRHYLMCSLHDSV